MAKPVNKKLDDIRIKAILSSERSNSLGSNASSDLSEQRIRSMDYYMGDMGDDMPAEEGLSAAVSTDVQDVVEGILPIVLDVFLSGDNVVEFKPKSPSDTAAAKQETDYINHVFYQENDGFTVLYTAIKDALLQKNGFVKWWMEDEESNERARYTGLTADAYAMLTADPDIEVIDTEEYQAPGPPTGSDPATGAPIPGASATFYNAVTQTVSTKKVPRIGAVPPEEILISKTARTIADTPYMAHVAPNRRVADVIKQFPDIDPELIKAAATSSTMENNEAFARQTVQDGEDLLSADNAANPAMRQIEITEHYIRLALEDDDVARRYRITTAGAKTEILEIEEISSWPFATGTPIMMPHRLFGRSIADLVIDVQQIKTSLLRATLNNAYFANNQRTEVSETHATENTIDDLLNNRVGGIVRTKMPGGLNQLEVQSIGHWVQPVIEYMDSVRENRTGVSRQNQGLDADTLNHTATGVTRLMDAGEMRVKLIARIFAETLIVSMFRGLHEMLQQHGEEAEVVQLNDQWVNVDPREWQKRKHMKITLPLGGASKQQLLAFFAQLLGIQQAALQFQGGPNGPLVSFQNIRASIEQMTRLAGLSSADPFVMQPPPPDPNAPKPPDPKMVEAQGKAQAAQAGQQADIQQNQQRMQFDQQSQQQKMQFDQSMAQQAQAAQRQRELDEFAHKKALDLLRFNHEKDMAHMKLGMDSRLQAERAAQDMRVDRNQADLDAELARKAAKNKPTPAASV